MREGVRGRGRGVQVQDAGAAQTGTGAERWAEQPAGRAHVPFAMEVEPLSVR